MNKHKNILKSLPVYLLVTGICICCGRSDQSNQQYTEAQSTQTTDFPSKTNTTVPTHINNKASIPLITPSPIPQYAQPLRNSGFLVASSGEFDMKTFSQNYWTYDLPDQTQLEVIAGGIITDSSGEKRFYGHPEAQQGILLVRHLTDFDPELGTVKTQERRFELPTRDGAAKILDARVEGERMLLTVRSFGGSVYVFDVNQGTFSAPQPPNVSTDGPYVLDPSASATLWMHAQGYDPAGVLLDYAWDLDGDGTFETAGQAAPIQLQALGGQSSLAVAVRATSKSGLSATAQAVVQVAAAAPTAAP